MTVLATRYHDFSYGHRVFGHESKCASLHGHNGRVHFHCEADMLDGIGRVIDFGVIKSTMCEWVETNWDHRFLVYSGDPWAEVLSKLDSTVVIVPFNPTAENMAAFLVREIGPQLLSGSGVWLRKCTIEETRKCSATYIRG